MIDLFELVAPDGRTLARGYTDDRFAYQWSGGGSRLRGSSPHSHASRYLSMAGHVTVRWIPRVTADGDVSRRCGVVLSSFGETTTLWVNGLTDDDGITVDTDRLPGWMTAGATFDVYGGLDELTADRFTPQPGDPDVVTEDVVPV
jgi:hypothetical protein